MNVDARRPQARYAPRRSARAEALGIGLDVQLLDVAAVGVDLDRGQHAAALVVVAVGELVAGGDRLHADLAEQVLVVVGPAAAHEEHRRLALAARADVAPHLLDFGHFLGDDCLDARRSASASSKYLAILRSDLAEPSAPMKFTLNQGTPNRFWIMSAT